MINYKKSLMSLAAVVALSTSATAGYIPLADSAGYDQQWVLFGVTGLKQTGAGAGTSAGEFSIADDEAFAVTDATKDELFTSGLVVDSKHVGKVKSISVDRVEIRIDTTGLTYNETEPLHTMYVTMEAGAGPAFVVSYRGALEGKTMEYSIMSDGSNAHSIVLSSAGTYRDPGVGAVIQDVAGTSGSALSKFEDALDYDFTDNPPSSSYYDKTKHQTAGLADDYLRVYSFDAAAAKWDLFDTRNTDSANNFDELVKGKAYWGKMEAGADHQAGLVLGNSAISSDEYVTAGITTGWNLLSFSATNSEIRKSSTGLILTLSGNALDNAKKLTIIDSSGNHTVDVAIGSDSITATTTSCKAINQAIKDAKLNGTMPETFNLKAFAIDATHMILISDTRFLVTEAAANDLVDNVTTLVETDPYIVKDTADIGATLSGAITNLGDVDTEAAMSKYGEYAVVIEPLVGTGNAAIKLSKLEIQNSSDTATNATPLTMGNDAAVVDAIGNTITNINGATTGGGTFKSSAIDTTYDEVVDKILIASDEPFFLRDHTFSRVFKYTRTASDQKIRIDATETAVINDKSPTDAAAIIDDIAGVDVDVVDTTSLVIYSSAANTSKFSVTENVGLDILEDTTTDDVMSKGAVKGIFSLDNLAQNGLKNIFQYEIAKDKLPRHDDSDTITFKFKSIYGIEIVADEYTVTTDIANDDEATDDEAKAWAEEMTTVIQEALKKENIVVSSFSLKEVGGGTGKVILNIESEELNDIYWSASDANDDVAANVTLTSSGTLVDPSADLAIDLRYSPVYAPNYVTSGPLYTISKAGFTMKAMVSGTTDITDGTVNWESIDLTRKPSEWLSSQDYSLFNITDSAGYWVYLEALEGTNDLSIVNATFTPTYTSHFNEDGTTYNNIAGQISIEVGGLPQVGDSNYDNSSTVEAIVNGSTIALAKKSTNNVYSGDVSSYESTSLISGADYAIKANIANGLGFNLLNVDTLQKVDLTKPTAPTIDITNPASVSFSSASTDVAGYYVFKGAVPEYQTLSSTDFVTHLTAAEATEYALCSSIDLPITSGADATTLNVFAVDGTGILNGGNASDVVTQDYIPMLKGSVKLSDTHNSDTDSTKIGTLYDTNCVADATDATDYGMAITSEVADQEVIMAYVPKNGSDTATPITIYVEEKTDGKNFKLTYSDVYVGSVVYFEVLGNVYSYTLESATDVEQAGHGETDTDRLVLFGNGNVKARPSQQL